MKSKYFNALVLFLLLFIFVLNFKSLGRQIYPIKYSKEINKYSAQYKIDPDLVTAVIKTESNFDSNAKSSKDANGLMQITDTTGVWIADQMKLDGFNVSKLKDPDTNINMGCWYINYLKNEFDGDMELVIAAYNGGIGNVKKWLLDSANSKDGKTLYYIPFKETDKYVKKVTVNYNIYKFLYKK